jgi:hypothetical protein
VVIWTVLKNKSADDDTTPLETGKTGHAKLEARELSPPKPRLD